MWVSTIYTFSQILRSRGPAKATITTCHPTWPPRSHNYTHSPAPVHTQTHTAGFPKHIVLPQHGTNWLSPMASWLCQGTRPLLLPWSKMNTPNRRPTPSLLGDLGPPNLSPTSKDSPWNSSLGSQTFSLSQGDDSKNVGPQSVASGGGGSSLTTCICHHPSRQATSPAGPCR